MSNEYTREWWKERLPLIQAFADNKKLLFDDKPTDEGITFAYQLYRYRIAPEPKLRPWKPEEVPVGALYRWRGHVSVILAANSGGISFIRSDGVVGCNHYEHSLLNVDLSQHSTDGGKTWHPCGVMEEQQ